MKEDAENGFTLLEILVVFSIITVLLSIAAVPFAEYIKRNKLRKTIELIDGHLREVRWAARMQARTILIEFDTEKQSYRINNTDPVKLPAGIRFGVDAGVTAKPGQPYEAPPADGVSFDSGKSKNIARYYASGTVSPTGTVFITNDKETMAVTVAITGRPKLWRSCGGKKWEAM